jgi:hypothetical protein
MSDPIALAVAVHQRALLRQRRCAVCAELVPAALVLSGGTCPRCGDGVHGSEGLDAEAVVADLVGRWRRLRWWVHGAVLVAVACGSWIPAIGPLIGFAVQGTAMVVGHLLIVRRALTWLRPLRRVSVRLLLLSTMALLATGNLAVSLALVPFPGASAVVSTVAGVAINAVYLEGALALVSNRLRREAVAPRLQAWEWAVPAGVWVALVAVFGATLSVVGGLVWAVDAAAR